MKYMTANEWWDRGFIVRVGERSYSRNAYNVALFSRDQVKRRVQRTVVVHHYYH